MSYLRESYLTDIFLTTHVCYFQVQRLAEFERYLGHETKNLTENGNQVGSEAILQQAQLDRDLHRIQELFPGDNLRLHERDILTTVKFLN